MRLITKRKFVVSLTLAAAGLCFAISAQAGAQKEEKLSASVRSMMQRAISDQAAPKLAFSSHQEAQLWLDDMSQRLASRMPDANDRFDFLSTVHYEASRAGLDPHLVLGLIEVESGFRKYAISKSGARGYMQVMPFWTRMIGSKDQDLFHLRTNLRYGCTILRHYLDQEKGDLYRALGRYNGSLGQPEYPNLVKTAWNKHWNKPQTNTVRNANSM